ncbi:FecCD family ABC transporter permease [Collimonas sp. NPDC087041]|uniref:FecCD family ABC transporter permease n=1 Tax=Collimonas sp. NPDC087041 TaxID=3363960 RepID=UPI0037F83314
MSSSYSAAVQAPTPTVAISPLTIARHSRQRMVLLVLALLLLVVMALCAGLGAYRIDPWQVPRLLWSGAELSAADAQARAVLLDIRMPRVLLAVLVGCGFGAAGSALQALFRNPLADPGLIGVSSGAALGAATTIVLGGVLWPTALSVVGIYAPMLAAFAGALAVALLVYRIGAAKGRLALPILLLAGIAFNAISMAGIGVLSFIAGDAQLRTLTFWNLGSLASAHWSLLAVAAPVVLLCVAAMARHSAALNAMLLGEAEAQHLGVPVQRIKRQVLIVSSLCVGGLVACTGTIGFIGLVAPHCIRLACGPDQRVVLPGAMLFGALLTLLADLAARTMVAPAELPLGILTALLGGPFFIVLLWRRRAQLGL